MDTQSRTNAGPAMELGRSETTALLDCLSWPAGTYRWMPKAMARLIVRRLAVPAPAGAWTLTPDGQALAREIKSARA